jgi:antitoxin component YwqK of YwqJK toxin-antitoxin module
MRHLYLYLSLLCIGFACTPDKKTEQEAALNAIAAGNQFAMTPIPGADYQIAKKNNQQGEIAEEGLTDSKGMKTGIWVIYQGDGGYPAKIANYVKGLYNGPYFEFDGFGRMIVRANYLNNKLHGKLVKFQDGNMIQESEYKDGVLDGAYKEFNRNGAVQKEINYKDGQLNGSFRYFDEKGKVIEEYLYKNGKQQ